MPIEEYIVLDLETTGLSKERHKITEIAAIKVHNGEIVDEFETLVNPECHIPSFITRLTGIDDNMVQYSPPIDKIIPHFIEFLGNTTIVAHNATFDYGFIEHNSKKHLGKELKNKKLCTRKLANRLLPELSSKKLGVICEHFDITNTRAHRAMADVMATQQVFDRFLCMARAQEIDTEEKFFNFEMRPNNK